MENTEKDSNVSQEKILDEYFMKIANLTSKLSKDPRCKVGACIVNEDKQIVGVGYNSMPKGREDSDENWTPDKKIHFVCHAEMNAIANKTSFDVRNCSIYVTLFPCDECAVFIIQAGIKEVIYKYGEINQKYNNVKSKTILDSTIKLRQLNPGTTFSMST